MANHIEKRRRRWYATLDIPNDVRGKLGGKSRFVQSLKTENRSQALRNAMPLIAHWKQRIADARGHDELATEALVFRDFLRKEKDPEQREIINDAIFNRYQQLWQKGAPPVEEVPDADEARELSTTWPEANKFASLAWDTATPINEHFEEWLAELDVAEKTFGDHRRAMKQLLKHYTTVEQINRKTASDFIRKTLAPSLKAATVNKRLNTYHKYWDWLSRRGIIEEEKRNPWEGQSVKVKDRDKRRGYTEEEGSALLAAFARRGNKYPDDLALTRLLAVTGMRVEEAASLKRHDLEFEENATWVHIRQGKTEAAIRTIPVVDKTVRADLAARAAGDGFVFAKIGNASKENGRAAAYKKRAARVLDKINPDPSLVANHSWRYRAIKLLEVGQTERHIADYFVGHAQTGESLRTYYTGGNRQKLLRAARLITLPAPKKS